MITQEQFDLEERLSEITGKVVCYKNSEWQPKERVDPPLDPMLFNDNDRYKYLGYTKLHIELEYKENSQNIVTAIVDPDQMGLDDFNKYLTTHRLVCRWVKPGVEIVVDNPLNSTDTIDCDSNYVSAIKVHKFLYRESNEMLRFGLMELEESLAWSKANLSLVDFIKTARKLNSK